MKKTILVCCLFCIICMQAYAQVTQKIPTVSKSEFTQKVHQLNVFVTQNNRQDAKAECKELKQMMFDEINILGMKVSDAQRAKNENDASQYSKLMTKQRTIYSAVLTLDVDMENNGSKIVDKLNEFEAAIL